MLQSKSTVSVERWKHEVKLYSTVAKQSATVLSSPPRYFSEYPLESLM